MNPLCTITTTDPVELQDLLRCITNLYLGVDGRQVELSYGLAGIHVLVEEPAEYVDVAERIAPHIPQITPVRLVSDELVDAMPADLGYTEAEVAEVAAALADLDDPDDPDEVIDLDDPPAKPAPAPDPDGEVECSGCDDRFRTRRALSDHIRAAHWDDIIASYASTGARGVMDDWGVSSSTAYNWAAQINGAAA